MADSMSVNRRVEPISPVSPSRKNYPKKSQQDISDFKRKYKVPSSSGKKSAGKNQEGEKPVAQFSRKNPESTIDIEI